MVPRVLVNIPSTEGVLRDGNCDGVVHDEQEESVVQTRETHPRRVCCYEMLELCGKFSD